MSLPEGVAQGDDCLNLNIWTPAPGRSALPVLVWMALYAALMAYFVPRAVARSEENSHARSRATGRIDGLQALAMELKKILFLKSFLMQVSVMLLLYHQFQCRWSLP